MSELVYTELDLFWHAIKFGISIGFLYDCIRIFRRVSAHNLVAVSIEDFLYWLFCGFKLFLLLYRYNNGSLRLYILMGVGIGMLLYKMLFGNMYVTYVSGFINRIKVFCIKIGRKLKRQFEKPISHVRARAKAAEKVLTIKRQKSWKYLKKKLTVIRKVIKIILCKQ